jgi:thiamine-phosphate pyrophosphorylase
VKFSLPPLYPIIDSEFNPHTLHFVVSELSRSGITLVQLREKRASSREFLRITLQALEISQAHQLAVIVNDRTDIAWLSGAHGVHLGQEDLPVADARKLLGPDKIIGTSTHNLSQALEAQRSSADYVAIGPIYKTTSKEKPDPLVEWEELKAIRKQVTKPLVAIGGITTENAGRLFELGVNSVAVIRDLLNARDISSKVHELLRLANAKGSLASNQ